MNSFIIALTLFAVVYGQEDNQLHEQHIQMNGEQQFQANGQQFEGMVDQHPNFRSAPEGASAKTPLQQHQEVETFVITTGQNKKQPQLIKLVQQQPQKQQEKFVLQLQEQPQQLQKEEIIIQAQPAQQEHIIFAQQQQKPQEIIVEVEEEQQKHKPKGHCELLRRKGECTSIPNFFSCIRDGGILAPAFSECSFAQACCIRNFFSQ